MVKIVQTKQTMESCGGDTFGGWLAHTLLEEGNIPIVQIAELALREGQSSNPLYRVHRWFARRVGSQFRSILTALTLPQVRPMNFGIPILARPPCMVLSFSIHSLAAGQVWLSLCAATPE